MVRPSVTAYPDREALGHVRLQQWGNKGASWASFGQGLFSWRHRKTERGNLHTEAEQKRRRWLSNRSLQARLLQNPTFHIKALSPGPAQKTPTLLPLFASSYSFPAREAQAHIYHHPCLQALLARPGPALGAPNLWGLNYSVSKAAEGRERGWDSEEQMSADSLRTWCWARRL